MSEVTIIVNTCDAYEDVWQLFFCAFNEYWSECEYEIILNTEKKQTKLLNNKIRIHNFHSLNGEDKWGLRLKQTLIECKSQYVLMLYDDFILEGAIAEDKIKECLESMDRHPEVAVFYFNNISVNKNISDDRFEGYELMPQRGDYKLNSAPSVWRREKLMSYVENNDNPWGWEFFGSYRTYGTSDLFYCVQKGHENIYPYNYEMGGAIYRGKWVGQIVLPLIEKYGLQINLRIRGLADGAQTNNKRSLLWKMKFVLLGFRMIGVGAFIFIYRALRKKLKI